MVTTTFSRPELFRCRARSANARVALVADPGRRGQPGQQRGQGGLLVVGQITEDLGFVRRCDRTQLGERLAPRVGQRDDVPTAIHLAGFPTDVASAFQRIEQGDDAGRGDAEPGGEFGLAHATGASQRAKRRRVARGEVESGDALGEAARNVRAEAREGESKADGMRRGSSHGNTIPFR